MVATATSSASLKEYLKIYEIKNEGGKKKKKKKMKVKPDAVAVTVLDEDLVWRKPVKLEEDENDDSEDEGKALVDEDIEVKHMKRLEQLRGVVDKSLISHHHNSCGGVTTLHHLNLKQKHYILLAQVLSGELELEMRQLLSSSADPDFSPPRRPCPQNSVLLEGKNSEMGLSSPMNIQKESSSLKEESKTGLITGHDIKENARTKKDDRKRLSSYLSVMTPYYKEETVYSKSDLELENEDGISI
ncbi:hypothetical protein Vadar_013188 [Vaccinium darrowii]|uniref:Uncharacterized protein n=1 Tax=Vaccinium darrowii TaxID=229202 RepID=A0ACB7Y6A9_9ERIC|nr:hypothetical protein Vadar_013188 [Vaccinium darrowii]